MTEEKLSYFIGLDIGTSAVRCVVGELSGEAALPTIIAASSTENNKKQKNNKTQTDEVSEAIVKAVQEAERASGREIRSATININGQHILGFNSKGVIAISSPDRQLTPDDRLRVEEAATIIQLPANKEIIQVFA